MVGARLEFRRGVWSQDAAFSARVVAGRSGGGSGARLGDFPHQSAEIVSIRVDLGHKIAEPRPWPRNADQEASSIRQHAVMSSRWPDVVLAPSKDVRAGISATSGTPARQWEKRKADGRKAHGVGVRACGLEG